MNKKHNISLNKKDNLPIFIHSTLDEYGLDPYEFRVYSHIARRASNGKSYESIKNMATICRMSEGKVKSALKVLVTQGLVIRESRAGTTTIYKLTSREFWLPPLKIFKEEVTQQPRSPHVCTQDISCPPPQDVSYLPPGLSGVYEGDPIQENPIEVNPLKSSPSISQNELVCESNSIQVHELEEISSTDTHFVDEPKLVNSSLTHLTSFEQSSAFTSNNIIHLKNATDEQIKLWFHSAYMEYKPSNFTNHNQITKSQFKKIKNLINMCGERALEIFINALTYVREQQDDWWRNKLLDLDNLMSNDKMIRFAERHKRQMLHDSLYHARVVGKAPSKDLERLFGQQLSTEQQLFAQKWVTQQQESAFINAYLDSVLGA